MIFNIKLGDTFHKKTILVGGRHKTDIPVSITYSLVVPRYSVRIELTISEMNELDILACDVQNVYLTPEFREVILTVPRTIFWSEQGSIMVFKMSIYGIKSSGADFRAKLAAPINDIGYTPSKAYSDVCMRSAISPDGTEYYKHVLC